MPFIAQYEGVAERKGPQHYIGLDKDSDDEDGDDGPSGDGPGAGADSSNGGGASGAGSNGGGHNGASGGGDGTSNGKRKANDAFAASKDSKHAKTAAGLGLNGHLSLKPDPAADSVELAAQSAANKQTIQAALRQRNHGKENADLAAAAVPGMPFSIFPPGQPGPLVGPPSAFPPPGSGLAMPRAHSIAGVPSMPGSSSELMMTGMQTISRSGSFPQDVTNLSMPQPIPAFGAMGEGHPAGLPIVISPATPGAVTPGSSGAVGGFGSARRSSFANAMGPAPSGPGGGNGGSAAMQRPVTANAVMGQHQFLVPQPQSISPMPNFAAHAARQQQGQEQAIQAATAAAAYAAKGAVARGFNLAMPSDDGINEGHLVARPASTGHHRPHHSLGSMTYAHYAGSPAVRPTSSASPTAVKIARPYTASGDFAAGHLAPPGASFGTSGLGPASVSPTPSMQGSVASSSTPMMAGESGPAPSSNGAHTGVSTSVGGTPVDGMSTTATPDNTTLTSNTAYPNGNLTINTEGTMPASSSASTFSSSDSDASLASLVHSGALDTSMLVAGSTAEAGYGSVKQALPANAIMMQPVAVQFGHHAPAAVLSHPAGFDEQMIAVHRGV